MSSSPRILVIDDDPLFRSFLVAMLRREHIVSIANDGAEGYAHAQVSTPQLVILDMIMPGWNGLQTLGAFRRDEILRDVPVIMMTSDTSRETVTECVAAGATNYLLKGSFSKSEILGHVRAALIGLQSGALTQSSVAGKQPNDASKLRTADDWN